MVTDVREQRDSVQSTRPRPGLAPLLPVLAALATMVLCVLVLFWRPFFTSQGALQWDALEVHYYNLSFSVEQVRSGRLPLWTTHIFGGFPQIADPQVGFWYPGNWLFFLTGISPDGLMVQLAAHYILAGLGAFLLARYLSGNVPLSIALGCVYAFGGFMIGHASHVGMQNTAAWLPLLTLLLLLTLERRSVVTAAAASAGLGTAILAGHFQTALFSAVFLGLLASVRLVEYSLREPKEERLRNGRVRLVLLLVVFIGAAGCSAVQVLPTSELAPLSVRDELSRQASESQSLTLPSLMAVLDDNHDGVARGPYSGPADCTQNYLFLGPLAIVAAAVGMIAGLRDSRSRPLAAFFLGAVVLSLLFALGPAGVVHALAYDTLPFFDKIRAPTNIMFIANLSLLMLAAFSGRLLEAIHNRRVALTVSLVVAFGLAAPVVFAASRTDLLYARTDGGVSNATWEQLPAGQREGGEMARPRTFAIPGLQLNEPQVLGGESFDGYNPLGLQRHARYVAALSLNRQLADVAGVRFAPCSLELFAESEPLEGADLCVNEGAFSRLTLLPSTITAGSPEEALALLSIVDLGSTAVLEEEMEVAAQANPAEDPGIIIVSSSPRHVTARVTASEDSFLLFNEAYYPGWQVSIDGEKVPLYRANYLFQGAPIAPGTHEVTFSFSSRPMTYGAILSLATLLTLAGLVLAGTASGWRSFSSPEAPAQDTGREG